LTGGAIDPDGTLEERLRSDVTSTLAGWRARAS